VNRQTLILRYGAFAAVATVANLAAQRVVLHVTHLEQRFVLAMLAGTTVGLILKYVLDKRWIFYDTTSGVATHSRKFALYTVMGIATTLVFWATETTFWLVWRTDLMRELGAVLGLIVGYTVKYNLDRRFVFSAAAARTAPHAGPEAPVKPAPDRRQ